MTTEQSLAGILEPVFAIRTEEDLGVGDTGGVRQMVDWCARHRLNIFQTLPINETGDDNSPYNAISSLAIEPGTISLLPGDLPDLAPGELRGRARLRLLAELRRGPVNYAKTKALKRALLEAAFARFLKRHWRRDTARAGAFRRFLLENAGWLSDYALFRLLMEENGGVAAWERWPAWHRTPRHAYSWLLSLPEKRRQALAQRRLFFCYVQWVAFDQWRALKNHAAARGVFLMGDIPFGIGRSSADVWANPDLFDLDWSGGAPPESAFQSDPFTAKWGQNWGVPNYRWDELRRRGFDWWRARVGQVGQVFHLYRIDHALGFFRIYSFPWTPDRNQEFLPLDGRQAAAKTGGHLPGFKEFPDDTPEHRHFNQRQGEEILRVLLEASGDTTVIAEDLGVVPDYVPAMLHKLGIPGFRIPAFFREHDGSYSDPAKYPRLSLTQPATHDHPPLAAAWAGLWRNIDAGHNVEENRRELRRFMDFAGLGAEPPPREFTDALHEGYLRRVLQSNSWLAVVLITDLFGQSARFNTPGAVSAENWTTRMDRTVAELDRDPALLAKTKQLTLLLAEANRGVASSS
jgi:4-alpha-glucanotransferase